MIVLLTDSEIINAANRGARRFMSRSLYTSWIGSRQDVLQEAQFIALEFLRRFDNPKALNPAIISRRVFYSLLDIVRCRSKYRLKNKAPTFYESDFSLVPSSLQMIFDPELKEIFQMLQCYLTKKEKLTVELLRQGYKKSEIARELGVNRSCITKRIANIRRKLSNIVEGRKSGLVRNDVRYRD